MKISDLLRFAKALIADERDWCQDTTEKIVGPWWTFSLIGRTQYSSLGALIVATKGEGFQIVQAERFLNIAAGELADTGYCTYNDRHPHADVMQMWFRAIERAEAAESPYADLPPAAPNKESKKKMSSPWNKKADAFGNALESILIQVESSTATVESVSALLTELQSMYLEAVRPAEAPPSDRELVSMAKTRREGQ